MRHYWNTIQVMPDDLRAFAWSAPMRELAAKLGMSDTGLKKLLASHGVGPPPQGHWNRVLAGKPVIKCPKAPARRPGETGRYDVDRRFAELVPVALPMPSSGPFVSAAVPEDLDELRGQELKALGRIGTPKSLDGAHAGLRDLLVREAKRREKAASTPYHWDEPRLDGPLDKRCLRILNGIFLALSKRGHTGSASERDGALDARAVVGDTGIGLAIGPAGKHATEVRHGYRRPAKNLPASTPLELRIKAGWSDKDFEVWRDDADGLLEAKVAPIAAAIITAGEAQFRMSLREAEERQEKAELEERRRRAEQLEALNRKRVGNLHESGDLLRRATEIRALVASMKTSVDRHADLVTTEELAAWAEWAMAEAEKLDPVMSGQILSHIRPPALPDV